jgi:hypothetical protein
LNKNIGSKKRIGYTKKDKGGVNGDVYLASSILQPAMECNNKTLL